jgi:hypothetical protein
MEFRELSDEEWNFIKPLLLLKSKQEIISKDPN